MNILEIEAFLAIIDTQSISKAAEKLYVSQSTISNRLQALEEEIGEKLIVRSQGIKTISLTPKGQEFVSFANRYMAFIKDLDFWKQTTTKYELKVAGPLSLNSYTLSQFFIDLSSKDCPIVLKISSHWNFSIYNLLESHNLDVGIVSRSFSSRNLITEPIFSEKMVMVSNIKYSNYDKYVDANSLDVNDEIYLDWGPNFEMWHNHIWTPLIKPNVIVDSPNLIEAFLHTPNAWAIVPLSVAVNLNRCKDLLISDIEPSIPNRTIYKIIQRNPNPSSIAALKIFNEELEKYIQNNKHLIKIK